MWDTVKEYIPPATALGIIAGLLRWLRPDRLVSLTVSVKERAVYRAMAEHEQVSGQWWMQQAQEAQKECERLAQEVTKLRADLHQCRNDSAGGAG